MAYQIRSDEEAYRVLYPALEQALDYAMQEIWKLNKQKIQTWVYNKYNPVVYRRTSPEDGGFGEAWDTKVEGNSSKHSLTGTFDYAPEKMTLDSYTTGSGAEHIKHTSDITYDDMREALAEIIYQGKAGDLYGHGAWTKKRDAFKQLERALGKGKLATYIERGMRKAGIKFKVVSRDFSTGLGRVFS